MVIQMSLSRVDAPEEVPPNRRRSLVTSLLLIMVVAPRFWFVAFIDFAIHITIDRAKGICASSFGVTLENEHPWFWTLIGVDQALHHLTGFGLAIFMAAN